MITLVGTRHDDLDLDNLSTALSLDHFDKIFTEGFSQIGVDRLSEIVENEGGPSEIPQGVIDRGPEPEQLEKIVDTELFYLDDRLSEEVLESIMLAELLEEDERTVTPYQVLDGKIGMGGLDRKDFLDFFRDIRDGTNYKAHDYLAINEELFEQFLNETAEEYNLSNLHELGRDRSQDFLDAIKQNEITFQNYVEIYAEAHHDFQYDRDQEWYDQIREHLEDGENALVIAGINHMLDSEDTLRSLLEQDYDTSVKPYDGLERRARSKQR